MMHRLVLILAILGTLGLTVFATPARAEDPASAPKVNVTNKKCPLMGDDTNPKYRLEYEGQYVYFCCSGCIDMFKADPKAAIAKMSDEDRAAIQKNAKCPMSGEEIKNFDIRSEFEGRFVYFCCAGCKTSFDKSHPGAK